MRFTSLAALLVCASPVTGQRDWCDYVARYPGFSSWNNISSLLQGETLRVVAFHEPPWSVVDETKPAGYGDGSRISGFEVELMSRLAEAGGFMLEYDYRIVNGSWTDALLDASESYDLVAGGGWMDTSVRRRLGVTFSTPISNQGVSLAIKKSQSETVTFWDSAFFFVKPFTGDAYPIIALFIVFPAILVWIMERERQPGVEGAVESVFMGWLNVLSFGDFSTPRNWFARGTMLLWGFACLVIGSAYTASLTSFLVAESRADATVTGASDFLAQGLTACIPQGWGSVALMQTKWGADYDAQLRETPPALMSKFVHNGECDGILLQHDYMRILLQGGPPKVRPEVGEDYGCQLEMVGKTEIDGVGAFPAGNTGCRWFVVQVIDSLIRDLDEQQVVEDLFTESVQKSTTHDNGLPLCPIEEEAGDDGDGTLRIGPKHLVGLIIVVFPAMLITTIAGLIVEYVYGDSVGVDHIPLNVDVQAVRRATLRVAELANLHRKESMQDDDSANPG